MATVYAHDLVQAGPDEQRAISELKSVINVHRVRNQAPIILGPDGEEIELPDTVFLLLKQLVNDLSEGRAVAVVSRGQELTSQQAADILSVSRPYLIKLLESGEIPFTKTGAHRRILFDDLIAYKEQRDEQRRRGLAQLTQMAEDTGDYETSSGVSQALDHEQRAGTISSFALKRAPRDKGKGDWRKTVGMFADDPIMEEIIEAGQRIREAERKR